MSSCRGLHDFGLAQFHPHRRMVARPFSAAVIGVDFGSHQSTGDGGIEQQKIHAEACVATEGGLVDPEGVDAIVRVQVSRGVDPALGEQPVVGGSGFGLEDRVKAPRPCVVDIGIGGYHVEVAGEHDIVARLHQRLRMSGEPFEPCQLVVELRTRLWVAVGQVRGCDSEPLRPRLEKARLRVTLVRRKTATNFHRRLAPREDRNAMVLRLAVPDRAVSDGFKCAHGKRGVACLDLLQARDVRLRFLEPLHDPSQAAVDAIDIEACDLHRSKFRRSVIEKVADTPIPTYRFTRTSLALDASRSIAMRWHGPCLASVQVQDLEAVADALAVMTLLPQSVLRRSRWLLLLFAVVAVAARAAQTPTDSDWPMPARDYASTRYAPLPDITRANVGSLKLAFTFSTGVLRGHEAAPIVAAGLMYIVTPYPNIVYALDLARPGAPLKWKFEPKPESFAQGVALFDVVNRGVVYADGKVFFNTLDNQTIALAADSGKELWRYRAGNVRAGETRTMAPLVVKGRVLVGNSGGEFGVRGWLSALDATSGKELWRAYSTGSDKDVLIGDPYQPFYAKEKGVDLGVSTWPRDAWKIGGGSVSGWISYDPELDLIYHGTGNPAPWNAEQRPGDNKFTAGLFARYSGTGHARWFYQLSRHDEFDYDGENESILIDLALPTGPRKVLVHPDRNGYVYVIDRATGEVISATPFVHITTSTGVDRETGALHYAREQRQRTGTVVRDICPGAAGAKNWQPSAYSPRTRLVYIPHQNLCQDAQAVQTS